MPWFVSSRTTIMFFRFVKTRTGASRMLKAKSAKKQRCEEKGYTPYHIGVSKPDSGCIGIAQLYIDFALKLLIISVFKEWHGVVSLVFINKINNAWTESLKRKSGQPKES